MHSKIFAHWEREIQSIALKSRRKCSEIFVPRVNVMMSWDLEIPSEHAKSKPEGTDLPPASRKTSTTYYL